MLNTILVNFSLLNYDVYLYSLWMVLAQLGLLDNLKIKRTWRVGFNKFGFSCSEHHFMWVNFAYIYKSLKYGYWTQFNLIHDEIITPLQKGKHVITEVNDFARDSKIVICCITLVILTVESGYCWLKSCPKSTVAN